MSQLPSEHRPPVEETWASKKDNIDWSVITPHVCELDFRGDYEIDLPMRLAILVQVVAHLSLASLLAWLLVHPIASWVTPVLNGTGIGVLAVLAGVVGAVWTALKLCGQDVVFSSAFLHPRTLRIALLPPLLWQSVAGLEHVHHLAGVVSYYIFTSLPVAIIAFDRFATHAVRWLTASATSHHVAKSIGRRAWSSRLSWSRNVSTADPAEQEAATDPAFSPVLDAIRAYRWGPLWILGATLIPLLLQALAFGDAPPTVLGWQILAGTFFALLAAVIMRTGGDLRIVPRFFHMLVHWCYYGWNECLPPWIFHSPCGDCLWRQAYLLVTVGLLAIPLTCLTAQSAAELLAAAPGGAVAEHPTPPSPARVNSFHCLSAARNTPSSCLWIAPTVIVALFLVPLHLCLIGVLLTGRLISSYQEVFEAPLEIPPAPVFPEDIDPDSTPLQGDPST